MRARSIIASLVALLISGAPTLAQNSGRTPPATLYSEDGYDIDRILQRSREMDAVERRVVPDDKNYDAWNRKQQKSRAVDLERARNREAETRRNYDRARAAERLQSMHPAGPARSSGDALRDHDTLNRLKLESERARRDADDAVPLLWRDRR